MTNKNNNDDDNKLQQKDTQSLQTDMNNTKNENNNDAFIAGYTDRLSGRPGDTIQFHVSSQSTEPFSARLVQIICSDPNPNGPGMKEVSANDYFPTQTFPSRYQSFHSGSFGTSESSISIISGDKPKQSIELSIWFYPTLIPTNNNDTTSDQIIMSWGPLSIVLGSTGHVHAMHNNKIELVSTKSNATSKNDGNELNNKGSNECLKSHMWYHCCFKINFENDPPSFQLTILNEYQKPFLSCENTTSTTINFLEEYSTINSPFSIATNGTFNGKLEEPQIIMNENIIIAAWDFATDIATFQVPPKTNDNDNYCQGGNLILYNYPTRAVKGRLWNGSEFHWIHEPKHYAAIYFHDDDVYDFQWKVNFKFQIPQNMPSGIYCMRLETNEGYYDAIPFFTCPSKIQQKQKHNNNDVCVLIPTFTYVIYGNHARADFHPSWLPKLKSTKDYYPNHACMFPHYGRSTYNYHSDNIAGICFASHKRPLFNLRPGYCTFGSSTTCSGLRHFPADTHLIAWLHAKQINYDIITDHDLHNEGINAIENYKVVMTGTHPEYHTLETLNALQQYRDTTNNSNSKRNLMYLGGNGFYWKISCYPLDPSLLEIRRCESGVRAWASEPGEAYHQTTGTYGGLWRRNGRPPQQLVGVGFAAQGNFTGMPYQRKCFDSKFDWVFENIIITNNNNNNDDDNLLGNFGFSGHGAAGFELDRIEPMLFTNRHDCKIIIILASSIPDDKNEYMLVPEEVLTHLSNISGHSELEIKRADMIYLQTSCGNQIFSVGSITFCGSLPWNNFDNNISQLLWNVLTKFLNEEK